MVRTRLWVEGRLRLRLTRPDAPATIAIINRPFALIGRAATADLPIASEDASLRHVYLHLNPQGVFAVDLVSRTGTRFDDAPNGSRTCWLRPGRGLELAGHRVELLEAVLGTDAHHHLGGTGDPLIEVPELPPLELQAEDGLEQSVTLLSELSFLGRSRACAVRVKGDDVARVHTAIVRSSSGSFIVNLAGCGVTINGQAPPLAAPLHEGDRLAVGRFRFLVRLATAPRPVRTLPGGLPERSTLVPAAHSWLPGASSGDLSAADVSRALRAVQDGQDDLIRTNDQFQHALVAAVRQLYQEQTALFERHLERLDRLQHEVAELRAELRERLGPSPLLPPTSDRSSPLPPPALPPVDLPPAPRMQNSGRATSWLIDRLGVLEEQVDQESRTSWRDLLTRLGPPLRARNDD